MKKNIFRLLLLIAVLVLSGTNSFAQYNWEKYPGNPLNIHGPSGFWNQSVTVPCVIFNSDLNRYEMWFTAFTGSVPNPGIGFTYSSDGITWSSPTLVMTPGPENWDLLFVGGVSVIKEGNLYKMWYTGFSPLQIGYATSPDGINWTKYSGNPVLSPGTGWESGGVAYPSVIKVPGGYWMFYSGEVSSGITRTGRAYSTDGIVWQKDTVNNPVLHPGVSGQWDQNNFLARVIEINDSLYMCYTAENVPANNSTTAIGFAKSADMGITWVKDAGNPIIKQGIPGNWDYGRIETGSIIYTPSGLQIYYDGSGPVTGDMGRIGLATAPCELPLQPGTYTVGTNGIFATIQEAFDKLGTDGVAGEVTLELIDDLYTAPEGQVGFLLYGPIPGAGPNKRVTIKPAENKNVTIEGYNQSVIDLYNTSYITIDGVGLSGLTTLTVHVYYNAQYPYNESVGFYNDCDHNIIQNITFISDDTSRAGSGLALYTPTDYTAACDSNLIQYNFIPRGGWAMYLSANNSSLRATGNIIRGNKIGSETDSSIAWGIQIEHCQNTIVEDNIVQNLKITPDFGEVVNMGINSWWGSGDIIRNNVVHGIKSIAGYMSVGILLSGDGNDNIVYNNMVYDIQSTSTGFYSRVSGIQIFFQNNPKIYYNSVYLSGTAANPLGSAALYIYSNVMNADIRNNILVNTRDESPFCASAVYDYSTSNITSNNNDLFYIQNGNNCLVNTAGTDYLTLEDWQTTGQDLNSVTEFPNFVEPYLHIDKLIPTYLESGGIPIVGIETDIDGEQRETDSTDIGADEFNGIRVPVELTSFTAVANDDEVRLNWSTATETNNRGFEVEKSVGSRQYAVGNKWQKIGYVEGYGTTTESKSYSYTDSKLQVGKYLYRLKQIDFDGSYEYSLEVEAEITAPSEFTLEQNYPNPFNPGTVIRYQLPVSCKVIIKVYDILGTEVATLVNENKQAGRYEAEFNPVSLSSGVSSKGGYASGVYFYQLKAAGFTHTKKMILLR